MAAKEKGKRFNLFFKKEESGRPARWIRVGTAFENSSKPGFILIIDAIPLGFNSGGGKLAMFPAEEGKPDA